MLPASIRQRLCLLNSSNSPLPVSQESLNPTPYLGFSLISASEPRLSHYEEFPNPSSRPATADSKESSPSVSTHGSGTSTPEVDRSTAVSVYEGDSGLKWNRVVPAFNLLRNAGFEAQQPNSDTRLIRRLYINGLGYLLEALPSDLSSEEARAIQDRLPEAIKPESDETYNRLTMQEKAARQSPPSYLHRIIAALIVYGFVLIHFIIPYAKTLLQSVYRYEKNHRIATRFLTTALETADGIGKSANNASSTLITLSEGRLVAAVVNLIAWFLEAVAGGVYDGVGEGLIVLGAIRPSSDLQARPKPDRH
ncbi:hypothetical protein BGW36DRAFT_340013 [Talaromyces proteolyticus]|uniref:Uncharacterized protein n=1 Tax=Talaromyces proteolyticus TaxID=1131652 RepID=A0AAD4Q1I8_9EURO|nr:uncharacterized protein BGW36DRAFT_340013 [Talaromyces proteolyticus]KAH8698759.1 hypothetical protein BGW36DRAFT_340013 [Talaromyces proteolyticus]